MNTSSTAYDEAAPAAAGAFTGGTAGAGTIDGAAGRLDREQTLQLRAERLAVDKTRVASGTARVGKRVVSETESVDVPVSHDELVIERRAVSGAPVEGTIGGGERTIEVPLSRDRVNVGKETYATEEVEVGTRRVEGVERVTDTVRHEELVVENGERGRDTAL